MRGEPGNETTVHTGIYASVTRSLDPGDVAVSDICCLVPRPSSSVDRGLGTRLVICIALMPSPSGLHSCCSN